MLVLPIKRKWFKMILSGKKKEEYREIKPYWTKRLLKNDINFNIDAIMNKLRNNTCNFYKTIILRNGYSKNSPQVQCRVKIRIGTGKTEWGAEKRKNIPHTRNIRNSGGTR